LAASTNDNETAGFPGCFPIAHKGFTASIEVTS
jgi:hypothetical protein